MKLSEAISLGSMLSSQAIGRYIDGQGGRCAWASASDAIGQPIDLRMFDAWTWTRRRVQCPVCRATAPVTSMIVHLNDGHRWSRQSIADWISTIEPTEETIPGRRRVLIGSVAIDLCSRHSHNSFYRRLITRTFAPIKHKGVVSALPLLPK